MSLQRANKLINVYYVLSIMLELIFKRIENDLLQHNIVNPQKQTMMNSSFKNNHRELQQSIKKTNKCLEKTAEDYTKTLSTQNFDRIRHDANFFIRCILRLYNMFDKDTYNHHVEKILIEHSNKDNIEFEENIINTFKMR